jgi:Uma2 family endonuclease
MARTPTETRLRMSYAEYEAWADEDTHSEWVDGGVTIFMPATARHDQIVGFIYALLRFLVDLKSAGLVFVEPFEMRLREGRSYREPDLLFVANEHLARIDARRLTGPADLVVEVLSEDDPNRDLVEKFQEYEAAGILEYWIVEGREGRAGAWLYAIDPDGRYALVPVGPDGRLHSRVLPGFWLDSVWLEADPLPSVVNCLRAMVPDAFDGSA